MKTLMQMIAFLAFLFGMILLFKIRPKEFLNGLSELFLWKPKRKLKERVLEAKGKKKKNWFAKLIYDALNILQVNKKETVFPLVCEAAFVMSLAGILFSLLVKNYFLIPVLGIGLLAAPFLYVKLLGFRYKKLLNEELETTLSIVTTSYMRNENIVTAINENLEYIKPPLQEIFRQFVFEANLINPDVKKLIRKMKDRLDNDIFCEWCDALISCQEDGKLKSTLLPIVKKVSNVRVVSAKLDGMLYEPIHETIMMIMLVIANIPLIYVLNKEWFSILVNNIFGQLSLALNIIAIFIAAIGAIRITRPIEYKR